MTDCPFCRRIAAGDYDAANDLAVAFGDGFPVSPGHTLVLPRRHEADFFALSADEQTAILDLVRVVHADLKASTAATGFNVGVNVGADAGQTVGHTHLHVIPRYRGDVPDPRGGIRCVIPDKAPYWE
jgi:diadenosine tetraphosphate (Ap4A) HIT family hydrolase